MWLIPPSLRCPSAPESEDSSLASEPRSEPAFWLTLRGADLKSTQGSNLSRDAVSAWGTPRARDAKGTGYSDSLPAQVMRKAGEDGSPQEDRPRLSVEFVTALMGFPPFWTRVPMPCAPSGTPSSPLKPAPPSESFSA